MSWLTAVYPVFIGAWLFSLIFGAAEWLTDIWAIGMCLCGMTASALQHSQIWLAINTAVLLFFVFALDLDLRKRDELKL